MICDIPEKVNNILKAAFIKAAADKVKEKRLIQVKKNQPIFLENVGLTFLTAVDDSYNFVLINGTKIDCYTAIRTKVLTAE